MTDLVEKKMWMPGGINYFYSTVLNKWQIGQYKKNLMIKSLCKFSIRKFCWHLTLSNAYKISIAKTTECLDQVLSDILVHTFTNVVDFVDNLWPQFLYSAV